MSRTLVTLTAVLVLTALVTGRTCGAEAATLYVAPNGNDAWSGRQVQPNGERTDGPLATLGAACRAARTLGTEARRRIVVQAGEYYIDEPIVLTDRDNGLTIEATASTDVTLYGGSMVTGWQKDGPDFCAATLPGVKEGQWDFRTLIVNGRYCPRARLPKEGRFEHRSVFDVPWMSTTGG